jgi:tetratricopeptide (TPR) repeat protein
MPTVNELIAMGYRARKEGQPHEGRKIFSEAVRLAREAGDRVGLAGSLAGLGQIERDLRSTDAALRCYREATEIYRSEPNRQRFAHTIRHLGDILRGDGALAEARLCYEEALSVYRADGATLALDLANTIRGFALLKGELGEREEAKSLWEEARGLYASVDVQGGVRESESQIAKLSAL